MILATDILIIHDNRHNANNVVLAYSSYSEQLFLNHVISNSRDQKYTAR